MGLIYIKIIFNNGVLFAALKSMLCLSSTDPPPIVAGTVLTSVYLLGCLLVG